MACCLSCLSPSQTSTFLPKFKPISPLFPIPKPKNPFTLSCFRPPETSIPQVVETFWRWLSENRIVSDNSPVKPGVGPEGLGLFAKKDIAINDVVLEVPKRFWISPDMVEASEIGSVCRGLKPWVSVLLFLIREKLNQDSLWRPYIDILPHSSSSPLFWSKEELSELHGSQILRTTLEMKELVQNEFLKAEKQVLIPNKTLFPTPITLDDFLWAFGMYRSRAFGLHSGQSFVLLPLADLLNHSSSITTEDHAFYSRGGLFKTELLFAIRSPIPVKAGEQVMIQYSLSKSNADMALDYGFLESKSRRDNVYTITLKIPKSDPYFREKLKIAQSNGLEQTADFEISLHQPLAEKMIPYLRLIALKGADSFVLKRSFRKRVWGHLELPISRANEESICRVVSDARKAALSGYHTTIEEDERLEKQDLLDSKLEMAVALRLGEKRVLQQLDNIFKHKELELDTLDYYKRDG